jgi:purine-binding chemotaxis protein CheW
VQLLVCDLADVRVGWPVTAVQEIVRAVALTRLPDAPPLVEGVVNVRGTLVPVLSLRARFALPAAPLTPEEHLVLVRADARVVACRVDRAQDVVDVDETRLSRAEGVAAGARGVSGVASLDDGLVVVHDPAAFLDEAEALAVDRALANARAGGSP